jgi:hypothetical protein
MSGRLIGADDLRRRFEALGNTRDIMRGLQIETVNRAKSKVPRQTGHLGRSIRPGSVGRDEAWINAKTPYARAVEFGSGLYGPKRAKYPIVPKKPGGTLFFPSQSALVSRLGVGQSRRGKFVENRLQFTKTGRLSARSMKRFGNAAYVHAKVVMHPGVKPRPFLIPAAKEAVQDGPMRDLIVSAWNDAA